MKIWLQDNAFERKDQMLFNLVRGLWKPPDIHLLLKQV